MQLREFRQQWLWAGVAYMAPWLLTIGVLRFWVGYAPWIAGDTVSGMFGFGLTWASLDPPTYYHVPIVVSSQLAAVAYLLSQQTSDLQAFHDTALALQIGVLVMAAAWFGWALARLNVSWCVALVCGIAAAAMPTASLTAVAFTGYGPITLWMGPGLTILAIAILQGRQTQLEARTALIVIGFVAANIYSTLPVAAAAAIAVLVSASPDFKKKFSMQAEAGAVSWLQSGLLFVALYSAILGVALRLLQRHMNSLAVIAAIAALAIALFWHMRRSRFALLSGIEAAIVSPLLAGWLIGCNVWAGRWFMNALYSAQSRGTGKEYSNPSAGLLELPNMLVSAPWVILLLGAVLFGLVVAFRAALLPASGDSRPNLLALAILVLLPIALFIPLVGDLLTAPENPVHVPIALRYFVSLLGVTAAAWALLAYQAGPLRFSVSLLFTLGVLGFGLMNFAPAAHNVKLAQDREARAADGVIASFLAASPGARVVCLRTEMPARCGLLYGYYYTFRSDRSRERLPVPDFAGGRIEYSPPCAGPQPLCAQLLEAKLASDNPVLFITEPWSGPLAPSCHDVVPPGERLRLISCQFSRQR